MTDEYDDASTTPTDSEISDQLNSDLYTRGWFQLTTLERNSCSEHGPVPHCDCPMCNNNPKTLVDSVEFLYVQCGDDYIPSGYNRLRRIGDERSTVQFMPLDPRCYYTLYAYIRQHTEAPIPGELLMNVCTSCTKTPLIDIPWCVVAKCSGYIPDGFLTTAVYGGTSVLAVPKDAIQDIFDLMADHGMYPTVNRHDYMKYPSSRLRLAKSATIGELVFQSDGPYDEITALRRYLNCDAVATATFTVTVHLTHWVTSLGTYDKFRNVVLWIHAIR